MTDADKLERIRSIVADHDAYGLSSHHEMVLDITDVLGTKKTFPCRCELCESLVIELAKDERGWCPSCAADHPAEETP